MRGSISAVMLNTVALHRECWVCCLQDCAVLGEIMAQEPDSIDAALERYERQRKPDVHALGTMDHQVCPDNLNLLPWQIASYSVQINSVLDREGPLLGKGVLAEELSGPGEHAYAG